MILQWLCSDTNKHSQLSTFSVVGMGGVGKTTLVQHVYNDPRMEEGEFDIKAWVCVSHEFDVFTVTKEVLQAITKLIDDSANLEMVQGRLKETLSTKRFLLVLDDVWNEDRDQWKALQTPLNYGAKGSKIIVTTRSNKVASTIHSNKMHQLMQLQEDHSWKVFAKHALGDDNPQLNDELKEIGEKIVQKCQGLPLALETTGSLLREKSSISEWESVFISKIWDLPKEDSKIMPALLLSYYHLPSHLKRCFTYCAIFPQNHVFSKKSLILLWMAENFLQCPQQSKSPEDVGEQFFEDLLSRSFFQQSREDETRFVLHDLLNDLAKYVCGDICFRFGADKPRSIRKTRHFSFVTRGKQFDGFGSLCDAERLRTFLPTHSICKAHWSCKMFVHEVFSKFRFLRVLSLLDCRDLKEVPDSVSELKHLCSLELSGTKIKKLPDSTCLLYNLQILKLNKCYRLEELPSTLHKLMNLRHLEFMHSRVRNVPRLLGKLKKLQTLTSFYVGQGSEFGIQQLAQLNLHGRLSIEELQNIVSPLDAYAANLKNKTHLVELDLKWTLDRNIDDSMKEREILENLQPSKHLQKLSIENYGGTQFPSWLFNGSLTKVVSIRLEECKHCVSLPPLGLLPFLKKLSISRLDGIVSINADFCGSSSSSFTSLETLKIYDMKEWEEWECKGVIGAFPRLQRLYISNCPKFKRQLPEQLCHLNFLTIRECKQLEDSTLRALEIRELDLGDSGKLQIHLGTTLERLTITGHNMEASLLRSNGSKNGCYDFLVMLQIHSGCDSLTTFPLDFFPKLCRLELRCGNLQMISQGHIHNHLEYLNILDCPQFESFPSEGLRAPFLEDFSITRLVNLKSLPKRMQVLLPSLTHLKIKDCPQVELFSDGGLPSNLESIDLINCSKLVASLKGTLRANPYLTFMLIGKLDVESFPDEDFLPLSLNFLTIFDCPNLKELEYKGLCHLSSLSTLDLRDCPSLHCLPEEGLPKSTAFFLIWGNCPLLKEHCQKLACQDWIEIADGRYIRVPIL